MEKGRMFDDLNYVNTDEKAWNIYQKAGSITLKQFMYVMRKKVWIDEGYCFLSNKKTHTEMAKICGVAERMTREYITNMKNAGILIPTETKGIYKINSDIIDYM